VTDEALALSHEFVSRCLGAAGDLRCTVDTNRAEGPFVAEWSGTVPVFRVRLACGRKVAAIRVFSGTLTPSAAVELAQALRAAARVAETFAERDCGGTRAEMAAAFTNEDPIGKAGVL